MFVVATIIPSMENMVFPIEWITGMHLHEQMLDGVNQSDKYLAFYSPDITKQANFGIMISDKFEENIDSCYIVSPIKFCGEY